MRNAPVFENLFVRAGGVGVDREGERKNREIVERKRERSLRERQAIALHHSAVADLSDNLVRLTVLAG